MLCVCGCGCRCGCGCGGVCGRRKASSFRKTVAGGQKRPRRFVRSSFPHLPHTMFFSSFLLTFVSSAPFYRTAFIRLPIPTTNNLQADRIACFFLPRIAALCRVGGAELHTHPIPHTEREEEGRSIAVARRTLKDQDISDRRAHTHTHDLFHHHHGFA